MFAGVSCQILQCPNVELVQLVRSWPEVAGMLAMKLASSTSASTIHTACAITSQRPCKRGPLLFGGVVPAFLLEFTAESCCFKRSLPVKLPSVAHVLERHQVFGSSLLHIGYVSCPRNGPVEIDRIYLILSPDLNTGERDNV